MPAAACPFSNATLSLIHNPKVMKWAENNPVVSAFGIWNSDSGRRTIKFMQYQNDESGADDRQSIISGYTESVITMGANNNNPGHGANSFGYRNHHVSGVGQYRNHARPRRRKQPLPEDITSSDSGINSGVISDTALKELQNPPSKPSYNKPALEWDVFLDPNLVRQVDAAMSIVDTLEIKLRKVRIKRERRMAAAAKRAQAAYNTTHRPRSSSNANAFADNSKGGGTGNNTSDEHPNEDEDNDDDFDILQAHTAAQVEVDRLVSQLLRRMIIAHGSMSQLVLEAMGVAPKYNFGTVVRSSRDGVGGLFGAAASNKPLSPSRSMKRVSVRAGNHEFSLDLTQTLSLDEEDEQRDFEALLDPSLLAAADGKQDKSSIGSERRPTASGKASSSGSKGMFMEMWIHVFARTLSLLSKSSRSGSGSEDHVIATKSSSASSRSNASGSGSGNQQSRLLVKSRPANIGQRGLSSLLEKVFLRRDSSFPDQSRAVAAVADDEVHANQGNNDDFVDDDLLANNDMFSPTTPTRSAFSGLCGMSLCLGLENSESSNGASSSFPMNPHASHKMAQDIERISSVLGEPLRLVLDLKSRRVPPRVWSRLIDALRTRGLVVEGIGSFDMDELRVIGKGCSYPLTPILFFHSVGDLQRACHANEVSAVFLFHPLEG